MTRRDAAPVLKLLTVNVNGLGSERRCRSFFAYQQHAAGRPDVTFVQEVKLGSPQQLAASLQRGMGPGAPWSDEWAYSVGTNHSRGAAILARKGLPLPGYVQHAPATDTDGRFVCWDWDVAHVRLRMICLYAPAGRGERGPFFQQLRPYLETERYLLIGGDFNCVLRGADQQAPSAHRRDGADSLQQLQLEFGLVDPWVERAQGGGFTHPATSTRCSAARLDRWLVSESVMPWVEGTHVAPGAPGDHHGVLLCLRIPDLPPLGRRGWSFPTYLLYHPGLLPQLREALTQRAGVITAADPNADPRDVWEALKAELRSIADHLHRQHSRQQTAVVHAALLAAKAALAAWDLSPSAAAAHLAAVATQHRLAEAIQKAGTASHVALEAAYTQQGERGSRWFHQLGRDAKAREPITHLAVPGQPTPVPLQGVGVSETISAATRAMYSSDSPTGLFRVEEVDMAAQDELLQHLQRHLPTPLRDAVEAQDSAGALTELELAAALGASSNGTAPGTDGLPYEVYRVLWTELGPHLLAATTAVFNAGPGDDGASAAAALPSSWQEGIITLIYKGKRLPRPQLSSYRPITLLNCDYKLVGKAIPSPRCFGYYSWSRSQRTCTT